MLFKLSNLNSNLALILGYLNLALNNTALFCSRIEDGGAVGSGFRFDLKTRGGGAGSFASFLLNISFAWQELSAFLCYRISQFKDFTNMDEKSKMNLPLLLVLATLHQLKPSLTGSRSRWSLRVDWKSIFRSWRSVFAFLPSMCLISQSRIYFPH